MSAELCIHDVSLRDGIQNEPTFIPMALRLAIVEDLIAAGVRNLQVASFVNPKRVPQMQAIEGFIDLLPNKGEVNFSALVLNEEGLRRLKKTRLRQVDLSMSCSDAHSRRNTGLGFVDARKQILSMIHSAKDSELFVRVGLQCVFDASVNEVLGLVQEFAAAGCDAIALADSTGHALPSQIQIIVSAIQDLTDRPIILHLHDTLGLGIANFLAGYAAGVRSFDAALGGLGGCPFIPGASGNLALEDLVHLCERLDIPTGITLQKVIHATRNLEEALAYPLPGKIHNLLRKGGSLGTDSLTKNPEP